MTQQAEDGARRLAAQAGDEVRAVGFRGGQLALEAGFDEQLAQNELCLALVSRRVRGVDPDQLLQQAYGLRPNSACGASATSSLINSGYPR